ncbi:MAG: HTH-type transcriptional activator IlvY [Desulfotalea sp.]
MKIRDLKLFRHLANTLHFGKTSRECHITPSGLTRTIQRIESDLGYKLLHRDNRSVSLTTAGHSFCEYCDESIERWLQLKNHLGGQESLQGELSLYCSVTAILSILPTIFRQFKQDHPSIKIRIHTGDAANAQYKLDNHEADISIIALPDNSGKKLQFIEFLQTPLIFIRPKQSHDLVFHDGQIDWHETPIIMPEKGLSRQRVNSWFKEKSIIPNIYSEVAGNEAIIAMVAMGCGIGVIPQLVMDKSPLTSEIEIIPTNPSLPPFSVGAYTTDRKLKEPIVGAFWETAKRYGTARSNLTK